MDYYIKPLEFKVSFKVSLKVSFYFFTLFSTLIISSKKLVFIYITSEKCGFPQISLMKYISIDYKTNKTLFLQYSINFYIASEKVANTLFSLEMKYGI